MVSIPGANGKHGAGDLTATIKATGPKAGRAAGFTATVQEKKAGAKEHPGWLSQGGKTGKAADSSGHGTGEGKTSAVKTASAGASAKIFPALHSPRIRGLAAAGMPPAGPSKPAAKADPTPSGGKATANGTTAHAPQRRKSAPSEHSLTAGRVNGPVRGGSRHAGGKSAPAASAKPAHEHSKTARDKPAALSAHVQHPGRGGAPSAGTAAKALPHTSARPAPRERHALPGASSGNGAMAGHGERGKPRHSAAGFAGSNTKFRPGSHLPHPRAFYINTGQAHTERGHSSQWGIGSFLSKVKTLVPNASGWGHGFASASLGAHRSSSSAGGKPVAAHDTLGREQQSHAGRKRNFPALKYRITILPCDISRLASEYAPVLSFPVRLAARKTQERVLGRVNGRSAAHASPAATPAGGSEPELELAPEAPSPIA